jgi:hypothetical protein
MLGAANPTRTSSRSRLWFRSTHICACPPLLAANAPRPADEVLLRILRRDGFISAPAAESIAPCAFLRPAVSIAIKIGGFSFFMVR